MFASEKSFDNVPDSLLLLSTSCVKRGYRCKLNGIDPDRKLFEAVKILSLDERGMSGRFPWKPLPVRCSVIRLGSWTMKEGIDPVKSRFGKGPWINPPNRLDTHLLPLLSALKNTVSTCNDKHTSDGSEPEKQFECNEIVES